MIRSLSLVLSCVLVNSDPISPPVVLDTDSHVAVLASNERRLNVSLCCPAVRLAQPAESFGSDAPVRIVTGSDRSTEWTCEYEPVRLAAGGVIERSLHLQWDARDGVLRKWLRLRLADDAGPVTLDEICLDTITAKPLYVNPLLGPPQSYPLFTTGFFAGIEFPVAATRWNENEGVLSHRPLCTLASGTVYESRRAVYGPAPAGLELETFHRYVEAHRPPPKGMHFNYNSWWTSPVPFSEQDILGLMKEFETNLYRKHGVAFDSFTIDMGWSDPHSVWDIDRKLFPTEFAQIQAGAEAMGSRLGLWTSPSSCYPPAVDPQWALDNGYESAGGQLLSLAGPKYRTKYGTTIADFTRRFKLAQVKLDGLSLGDATFRAGDWPTESVAAGAVEAFRAMRAANPEVWLEATYSAYASPWWLFDVNSVIGCFGDDSPHGRVPCPIYRESYTTARDFYNFLGADRLYSPIPAQEVLGIIHQSNDDFLNDAVTTVLRGHAFVSLYVNPKYMNDTRWSSLAGLMQWARRNAELLTGPQTQPLRPRDFPEGPKSPEQAMPRAPYGYAHWQADRGLILLRNPWIVRQTMPLTIGTSTSGALHVVSVYPEPRVYARAVQSGQSLDIPLAPYETIVLSIGANDPPGDSAMYHSVPQAELANKIAIQERSLHRVVYDVQGPALGSDFTCRVPASGQEVELTAEFDMHDLSAHGSTKLLVLLEQSSALGAAGVVTIDGMTSPLISHRSESGFTATGAKAPESWHFLESVLPAPTGHVVLRMTTESPDAKVSVWLWSNVAPGDAARGSDFLPSPEFISLDSVNVVPTASLSEVSDVQNRPAPVDHIDGVYLDAVQPISCVQGWGTLQSNQSVWEKPLNIGGQPFRRGLGTHARSEIVYALAGKFSRFDACAGPDMATNGSMVFAVLVDGVERWRSSRLVRGDQAQQVKVDIRGAHELKLIVEEGGDNIMGDHADWAEAKLLH